MSDVTFCKKDNVENKEAERTFVGLILVSLILTEWSLEFHSSRIKENEDNV